MFQCLIKPSIKGRIERTELVLNSDVLLVYFAHLICALHLHY
uniref:Uncharacterized protein n=1 Tax=Arundo donax TaxID=35708 RepID=A0A0A8YXD6_ARUDO